MRRRVMSVVVALAAGGSVVFGAANASAVALNPIPGGTEVYFDHGESSAIANLNLGPLISQTAVAWSPGARANLGQGITEHAQQATVYPNGGVAIDVYGLVIQPSLVVVTTLP